MDLWTIFWTALVVGFSGAMMPGPLLTVTIGETARRGFVAGPLIVLGHAILEITLVVLLVLGVAQFLASDRVHTIIALVGGAFLVFMGWTMTRDAWRGTVNLDLTPGKMNGNSATGNNKTVFNEEDVRAAVEPRGLHPVLAGILVSLSNPFWSLWWATVGLAYISTALSGGAAGVTAFTTGHLLSDLVWYGLVSAAVDGGRRFMSRNVYRVIIAVCGLFLVGLGVYFFVFGGLA